MPDHTFLLDDKDHRDIVLKSDNSEHEVSRNYVDLRRHCPKRWQRCSGTSAVLIDLICTLCRLGCDQDLADSGDGIELDQRTRVLYTKLTYRNILKTLSRDGVTSMGAVCGKIVRYARVHGSGRGGNRSSLGTIRYLLDNNTPVAGAIPIAFRHLKSKNGMISSIDFVDRYIPVLIIGYIDNYSYDSSGYLVFRSPFGHKWGDKGYGYISYDVLKQNKVADMWTITLMTLNPPQIHDTIHHDITHIEKLNMKIITNTNNASSSNGGTQKDPEGEV